MGAPDSTTAKPPAQLASPVSPPAPISSAPAANNNTNNLQGRHVSSFKDWLPQDVIGTAITCMTINMFATSLKLGLEVCETESTCCKVVYGSWSVTSLCLSGLSQCFVKAMNSDDTKEKQQ